MKTNNLYISSVKTDDHLLSFTLMLRLCAQESVEIAQVVFDHVSFEAVDLI